MNAYSKMPFSILCLIFVSISSRSIKLGFIDFVSTSELFPWTIIDLKYDIHQAYPIVSGSIKRYGGGTLSGF